MPPKQRITKEAILQAAFDLVRLKGMNSLNARNVAEMLNCSTQPIFSCYKNMAALEQDIIKRISDFHTSHFDRLEINDDFFINVCNVYLDFALEEPNLFKLLFMSDGFAGKKIHEFIEKEDSNDQITARIRARVDEFSGNDKEMFTDMWLYVHGIASMMVMNQLSSTREELGIMIRRMVQILIAQQESHYNGQAHKPLEIKEETETTNASR